MRKSETEFLLSKLDNCDNRKEENNDLRSINCEEKKPSGKKLLCFSIFSGRVLPIGKAKDENSKTLPCIEEDKNNR